jgi:hypothetical protein
VTDPAIKALTRRVIALQEAQRRANRTPQLTRSSIDNGSLNIRDATGQLTGLVGVQYDGTTGAVVVAGPIPPVPTAPVLEAVTSGVRIRWDGTFVQTSDDRVAGRPTVAPLDFRHVEVQVSEDPDFREGPITRGGVRIASEAGGYTFVPWKGGTELYARLVCWTWAGKFSAYSLTAGPVAAGKVGVGDVGFDLAQLGGARMFYQPTMPNPDAVGLGPGDRAVWWDSSHGNRPYTWAGDGWTDQRWTGEAILPKSVIGGDVLVDGTVTAPLLQALLVLTTAVVAGDPDGDHARMNPTGFRVYKADPQGGTPDEVVRMGTDTNDYFGIVNGAGDLVGSWDDTGRLSATGVEVSEELRVKGRTLATIIEEDAASAVGFFEGYPPGLGPGGNYGPIRDRVGISEVNGYLRAGRRYRITSSLTWLSTLVPAECRISHTFSGPVAVGSDTAGTPLVTSPQVDIAEISAVNPGGWQNASVECTFVPTTTGRHRFLVTIERGVSTAEADIFVVNPRKITMRIEDTGPAVPTAGSHSQGGGTIYQGPPPPPPPPPTQQYYVDLGPVGRASWRGNGSLMTGYGNDVYQGYYSTNGDQKGMFWFDLPTITGTVDRVDVYMYFRHWFFNSGGTVIMNISDQRGVNPNFFKFRNDWYVGGWPKPGPRTVTIPWADWLPFFRGTNNDNYNGRATCITLGPSGGTNQTYYGVATDCRLRLWYTQ